VAALTSHTFLKVTIDLTIACLGGSTHMLSLLHLCRLCVLNKSYRFGLVSPTARNGTPHVCGANFDCHKDGSVKVSASPILHAGHSLSNTHALDARTGRRNPIRTPHALSGRVRSVCQAWHPTSCPKLTGLMCGMWGCLEHSTHGHVLQCVSTLSQSGVLYARLSVFCMPCRRSLSQSKTIHRFLDGCSGRDCPSSLL
jgi:hypothetical protein